MSQTSVTGILRRICADNDTYASKIELKGHELNIGRGVDNNIVWPSIQLSRKHVSFKHNRRTKKWQMNHTSTNGVLVNDIPLEKSSFRDLEDGDEITFIPTGTLKYRFHYPKKIAPSPSIKAKNRPEPVTKLPILAPTQMEMEVEDDEIERPSSRCSDYSLLSIHSDLSDVENQSQMKLMQDHLLKSLENMNEPSSPQWDEDERSLSQSILLDDQEPSPKRSRFLANNGMLTNSPLGSTSERFTNPPDSIRSTPIETENKKDQKDRLLEMEEENRKLKAKLASLRKENIKVEADMNLLRTTTTIEQEEMQAKIDEAKFETSLVREELAANFLRSIEAEFSCVICNEVYVSASVINCGHTFCTFCISTWASKKNECPTCRTKITSRIRHVEIDNFIQKVLVENPISEASKQKRLEAIKEKADAEIAERNRVEAERRNVNAEAAQNLQNQLGIEFQMIQPRVQLAARGGRRGRGARNANANAPPPPPQRASTRRR